jgi:hypothetical protein
VSGITTALLDFFAGFGIDSNYNYRTPIVSSATFNGQTLASLGFTTSGLIGTWSITGTSETIQVYLGNRPCSASAPPSGGAAACASASPLP